MALLMRLKSATIVETLVASVIIVVVFSMTSLILNNTFKSKILSNSADIENYSNKLFYLVQHSRIGHTILRELQWLGIKTNKRTPINS